MDDARRLVQGVLLSCTTDSSNNLNMMTPSTKRRAVVIVGAGASVEYGIPVTAKFGELIDQAIQADAYCVSVGGAAAYFDVKQRLTAYYGSQDEAHFERIYHVMHELSELRTTPGAVPKFLPVMYPFVGGSAPYETTALNVACRTMLTFIYEHVSAVCAKPACSLAPLGDFFECMLQRYVPRVYTTNYDDFVGQATGDTFFTGFTKAHGDHLDFDPASYWSRWDEPGLFHVHGSIHMGFPRGEPHDIGDIAWYPSKAEAAKHATFNGSGVSRMDGTMLARSAIITGLDKLGRLQQSPYAPFYAGLNRDLIEADVIFVLGSGLTDLHLNTYLKEARRARPDLPILFVGYWGSDPDAFPLAIHGAPQDREISLFHDLRIDLFNAREVQFRAADGWTVDAHGTAAVWADGFQSFLNTPAALQQVMRALGAPW
ncbi:SIR2 family protein [Paraburkholderia tagetis]|uniref:SIR2 family protein n=1 Tax=Paraburkholderia tagetis TaxID=2913261 RepID=A0A9X1RSE2_9BURK|nr:SIR2 family protein [Paraburkholderia tagetis]MCG5076485.1 SIR2 family protein [Paraburkholderia tagetis]